MGSSTPANRTIAALRRRADKHKDPYLLVVADEMERAYVLLLRRGAQLQFIEGALGTALARIDNEVSDADRESSR